MQRKPFIAPKLTFQDLANHNSKIDRARKVTDLNSRKAVNLGVVRGNPKATVYNGIDTGANVLGTGLGIAGSAATVYEAAAGVALFNPYVATGIAAAGAAVGAYQLGKSIYHAIF